MDGTESLVKGFTVDMDPQEATALQEKVEVSRRSYTVSGPPLPPPYCIRTYTGSL